MPNDLSFSTTHAAEASRLTRSGMAMLNMAVLNRAARIRTRKEFLLLGLMTIFATCAEAAGYSQQAVNKAHAFLKTEERGKEVLGFVHLGADYHGHRYSKTVPVNDGQGSFALVYRFDWEDDGVTDVAFLCDANGIAYRVQILYTNAQFNQPFLLANLSIGLLGHGLIDLYRDKLTDDDRQQLHEFVRKADAKGLLEWSLRFEQFVG